MSPYEAEKYPTTALIRWLRGNPSTQIPGICGAIANRLETLMSEVRRLGATSLDEGMLKQRCRIADYEFLQTGDRSDEWEWIDPVKNRVELTFRACEVIDHLEVFKAQYETDLDILESQVKALKVEREQLLEARHRRSFF